MNKIEIKSDKCPGNRKYFNNMTCMKSLQLFLTILMPIFWGVNSARGNTYYFSSTNGDDSRTSTQAMQASSPWRTLGKLNQVFGQLQPGDSVLFKRGEVFYGPIVAGQSGVAGRPIVFAAYGQGYDPDHQRVCPVRRMEVRGQWNMAGALPGLRVEGEHGDH
jgi:hypothetical protein